MVEGGWVVVGGGWVGGGWMAQLGKEWPVSLPFSVRKAEECGHDFYSPFLEKWGSLAIVVPPPFHLLHFSRREAEGRQEEVALASSPLFLRSG